MSKLKLSVLVTIIACFFVAGCGADKVVTPTPNTNTPTAADEKILEDLDKALEEKQVAINQTKTYVQRKIPKSKVVVDLSTDKENLTVMVDVKMTSSDVEEAKQLAKQYLADLSGVPAPVIRYDFTFVSKGKLVCMITQQKDEDKLSVFADGKTSQY